MADSSQFFFSILRVSIIQILRSVGFDRCSNRVIDILTDLYIRRLSQLALECQQLAGTSDRLEVEVQDVAQTMVNYQVIRPGKYIDPYDTSVENYLGMKNFIGWLKSDDFTRTRKVGLPSDAMMQQLIKDNNRNEGTFIEEGFTSADQDNMNWFKYLLMTQSKMEYDEKVRLTVLGQDAEGDQDEDTHVILGPTPEYLVEVLPGRIG
ncbi:Taf3 protein [Saccharomycopsis crataegensis]|uniref:Taf3 protein n=1 Tax=Saccharomycopsis crataegensis TaxID=43959 RepID=A0AAV5QVW3_9ASCO|nr:Taf3 protein [Saccharomycopsis crataegensis]